MFLFCTFTGLRHGKRAVENPESQIVQQRVEVPEIQTSESLKSTHVRQVAPTELKHMFEKVEMNAAMLTADIEERADVDECRQSVDDELSDLGRETASDSERDRVKSYMSESCGEGALTRTRQQQCVCGSPRTS